MNNLFCAGNFPSIERDPTIKKLEFDVFSKMADLIKTEGSAQNNSNQIIFVSFEDALKELVKIKNTKV